MGRDDLRRELRDGFESISGAPDAGLPARVHAALVDAPEKRGPVWIAGLAATLMAALVIGLLYIAGPLRQQAPIPGLIPSPSPSALPTSDTSNLPAMSCASAMSVATDDHVGQPIAYVSAVRVGTHTGYDRITLEFKNGLPGDIQLSTQSSAVFTQSASGRQVTLQGSFGLLVTLTGADDHTSYAGSTDFQPNYPGLLEVRQVEDFEGYVQWGLGLSHPACYRAFVLQSPTRLVIDVANS